MLQMDTLTPQDLFAEGFIIFGEGSGKFYFK
jgi:hypothetical protein